MYPSGLERILKTLGVENLRLINVVALAVSILGFRFSKKYSIHQDFVDSDLQGSTLLQYRLAICNVAFAQDLRGVCYLRFVNRV